MSVAIDGLLYCWNKNLEYGPALVADLSEEQMILQPVESGKPANHTAWVFSHLNVYLPLIACLIQGETFEDPADHPFGKNSKPESDPNLYGPKAALVEAYIQGHQKVADLLKGADDSVLEQDVLLPRWKQVMPKVGIILPYLMLTHECTHLGQLSAWRRIQGMPSV